MSAASDILSPGRRTAERPFVEKGWLLPHRTIAAARIFAASQTACQHLRLFVLLFMPLLVGCHFLAPKDEVIRIGESDSTHSGEAAYRLAMHSYRKGHVTHAAEKLEKVVLLNPRHAAAQNNLGIIYYQQRKLALAASHFDLARELLPDDPLPLNNLGMTFEAGGRVMEAIQYYERASELAPENPLYLGNLLRARLRLGERNDVIIDQLRYLAFIETRPDWIAWIDEQLAIHLNPTLDRGPAIDQNEALDRAAGQQDSVYRGSISDNSAELEIIEAAPDDPDLQQTPAQTQSSESLPVPAPLDTGPRPEAKTVPRPEAKIVPGSEAGEPSIGDLLWPNSGSINPLPNRDQ